jgi:hypothetical protein
MVPRHHTPNTYVLLTIMHSQDTYTQLIHTQDMHTQVTYTRDTDTQYIHTQITYI